MSRWLCVHHVRHSLTDGTGTWQTRADLVNAIPGSSTDVVVPLLEGEILVKFQDDLGNRSVNATSGASFSVLYPGQTAG